MFRTDLTGKQLEENEKTGCRWSPCQTFSEQLRTDADYFLHMASPDCRREGEDSGSMERRIL